MTPSWASWARWRDTVLLGCPVAAASVRTEGKQRPVRSANATRFCSVQCRCRRTVRYRSRVTGTKASMTAPWLLLQLAGSGAHRAKLARGKKALAIFAEVGKARCRQTNEISRLQSENPGPPLWRAFALWVSGLAVLREVPREIARAWRAWRNISCPAT